MSNNIQLHELSLIVLVGPSGAGKSTFARQHFKHSEIISSDYCREMVADDANTLDANEDTFDLVHYMIKKRLKRGLLTVVDATNLQAFGRKKLLEIAKKYHVFITPIVFNFPERICQKHNELREDRQVPSSVIRNHVRLVKRAVKELKREGFKRICEFRHPEELEHITIERQPFWNNKKQVEGPFDIIGDIHGCFTELQELLHQLGYQITKHKDRTHNYGYTVLPPPNRKVIFVGDLVDRGPASNEVLRLAMSMIQNEQAYCVCGNHDDKLRRKLEGRNVQIKHGLAETLSQLSTEPEDFIISVKTFLSQLISHYVFDGGKLVVAHAGLKADMHGRASGAIRSFCLYGETTGEIDEFGLPVRLDWAQEYRGKALVVYGHTPVPEATWVNNTIDIDTGCVFGGKMTALRYPERTLVQVQAKKTYSEPTKPLVTTTPSPTDYLLDYEDFSGRRTLHTRLQTRIMIKEANAIAALETMSRFAINPRWLLYLPPTMSPPTASEQEGFLEHPEEALAYYRENGQSHVICEEKHMGSRAIAIIAKDEATVAKRFGITGEGIGTVYTRTGRAFFNDSKLEAAFLERLRSALTKHFFWEKFQTDWVALDCELMPWSAKAQKLLQEQYAAVGAATRNALPLAWSDLLQLEKRGIDSAGLSTLYENKVGTAAQFTKAYRQYCWPVKDIDDYRLAPFHILATENRLYFDQPHDWHMSTLHELCAKDSDFLQATNYQRVDLYDSKACAQQIAQWEQLTHNGGEGMVIKPESFIAYGKQGIIQPAIKCRGREYLRIIYGPEYTFPENLTLLRKRSVRKKRHLALQEFALGVAALERFIQREPLWAVHECVFGVLALESEGVDPRL